MFTSAIIEAVLKAFFNAFGATLNSFFDRQRADRNAKDLGRAEAQVEQGNATITAQQAELEAQANAPRSVDDAIKRLNEGSA